MSFLFLSETPLSHPPRLDLLHTLPPFVASSSSHLLSQANHLTPKNLQLPTIHWSETSISPPLSAHHDHHAVTPQMPAYTNTLNFQRKRRDGQTRARSSSSSS
ncbi:hypothetical protein J3E68DRAFT_395894 [Trichoderma sp. SZMC 28012]